jgi:hypothetical protein
MATKREVANAQAKLNEAVGRWVDHHTGVGDIIDAYREWDRLRRDLEGAGPAVGSYTSIKAAKSNVMLKASLRREILVMVCAHWNHYGVGMTTDLIQARLKGQHQTVSARVSELVNKHGLLVDTGTRAKTRSGADATVWGPTALALEMVAAAVTGRDPE